jgi:hypothetical protein
MKKKKFLSIAIITGVLCCNMLIISKAPTNAKISGVASRYAEGDGKTLLASFSIICTSGAQICMIGGIFTAPEAAGFAVLGF